MLWSRRKQRELGARNVHVLPHFVSGEKAATASLPADAINIVHSGSVELSDPSARIEDMLRPFEAALAQLPALRLHLVGRLSERERTAAAVSPATRAIILHGARPLEEALALTAAADALIFVASGKMHVPPSKMVDYLAAGAPIIACGVGPWRADPRVPSGDPVVNMATLVRGARNASALQPPTARDAAARLLRLMTGAWPRAV